MANTRDAPDLSGLILARRRRGVNDLLVKAAPNDAAPVVFGDLYFDAGGPTNYTLTASGGSYTLAGQSATLKRDRSLTAQGGSYALTGASAVLTKSTPAVNYTLTALGGSYAITGQSASINRNRRLTASGGAYAITGQSVTLLKSKRLVSTGGAYSLAGQAATLRKTKLLTASGGAYTLAGATAILERDRRLTALGGTYALAGQQATITYTAGAVNYTLTAQGGSYFLSGGGASIQVSSEQASDTHDGYFHKLWRKLKEQPQESSIEAIAQRIDAIEDQIAEVQARPLPIKPIYIQSVPMPPIEAQAKLIEALIVESVRLRRELQDEEDAEILLLL